MSNHLIMPRRSLLIGGASLALVGCGPDGGGSSSGSGSSGDTTTSLPSLEDIAMFLTITSVAGGLGGMFAGAIGLTRLAGFLGGLATFSDRAGLVVQAVQFINQRRSTGYTPPASGAISQPVLVPANGTINDFDSIPVFKDEVTVKLGVLNDQRRNFGNNKIYSVVKRAEESPPTTFDQALGSGDLPYGVTTPASFGNWDGTLPGKKIPADMYVSYSWLVPQGEEPSDEHIASKAFIGPAFLVLDEAAYSSGITTDIGSGSNVEARFGLPENSAV